MFGLNWKGKCWFWGSMMVVLVIAVMCMASGCSTMEAVLGGKERATRVGKAADKTLAKKVNKTLDKAEAKAMEVLEEEDEDEEEDE